MTSFGVLPRRPADLEEKAASLVPHDIYDFFAGGADQEVTLEKNVLAWEEYELLPSVPNHLGTPITECSVLGARIESPVLVGPVSYQRLAHPEGEVAMARGVAEARSLLVVPARANTSLEEIAKSTSAPLWFQTYIFKDRGWTEDLIKRAADSGYLAIVVTVDAPIVGRRVRDERNRFQFPKDLTVANLPPGAPSDEATIYPGARHVESPSKWAEHDPSLTYAELEWVKGLTKLPLVVKGVMRPEDAIRCVASGADAVVVSNHGGRQLDTVVSSATALPAVTEAIAGTAEVYVDGGVRNGTDVLKALALGARAVLVARPAIWGLVCRGSQGVNEVLRTLREELARSMELAGADSVGEIGSGLLRFRS